MKEYNLPPRAFCKPCTTFGGPCPYCNGVTCPRFRRNNRLAGILISVAAIVIVLAIAFLCGIEK
jgi:hypothetical protein